MCAIAILLIRWRYDSVKIFEGSLAPIWKICRLQAEARWAGSRAICRRCRRGQPVWWFPKLYLTHGGNG